MSRLAREISPSGLYHIVFRGISKQNIFEEDTDYLKMIYILQDLKKEMEFEIYAYCFMTNHAHILLKEKRAGEVSQIMKRLLTKYAMYFNKKYQRSGTLIANRYKSQPVSVDDYFLSVVRYIHQNPVKAGLTSVVSSYRWSSYNEYYTKNTFLVDAHFVFSIIPFEEFEKFHQVDETELFLVNDKIKISDEAIRRDIIKTYNMEPFQIGALSKNSRNSILYVLKKKYSIRQLERVTGISRGVIANVKL